MSMRRARRELSLPVALVLGATVFLMASACSVFGRGNSEESTVVPSPPLSLASLRDLEYFDAQDKVFFRFVDEFYVPAVQVPVERAYKFGLPNDRDIVASGDLDGDGDEDAVVLVTMHIGAGSQIPHLMVVMNDDGSPKYETQVTLTDRTLI